MKKNITRAAALLFIAVCLLAQQSCVKDACKKNYTYSYFQPVYKTSAEVRANIKSNAAKPIANPGKIYIKDNFIFLNEVDKGIHVIDNSNPALPKNIAFIDLPGNVDIAIKNNFLYADFYTDLVVMDVSNPVNVSVVKFVNNVFPERYYYGFRPDSAKVIADWVKKTETVECNCNESTTPVYVFSTTLGVLSNTADAGFRKSSNNSPVGISGSLARFALVDDHMYAVANDSLRVINVASGANPYVANAIKVGWGIETIFPLKDKLFIGSNTGMFIYSIQNPAAPAKQGTFEHVRSCDPVIADDNYAYVTLHSGTKCAGFSNQMDVLDIANIQSPQLIKTYLLSSPRGLSKDGNLLFICDGNAGLKVFNAPNATNITLIKQFAMAEANDVIAFNNIALVVAKDGLYQYDYSNPAAIKLLSSIQIEN